jgi:RND family efflux transporter MFP subunit
MLRVNKKLWLSLIFLGGLILLLLWMQGFFRHRIGPEGILKKPVTLGGQVYPLALQEVQDWQEAPGLVAAREQAQVASQIMGRILEVRVAPGALVKAGEVLARVDDAEVKSRLGQTQGALAAAQAQWRQTSADFQRFENLVARGVTSRRDFEAVKARFETAQAQVKQASQAVKEARVHLNFAAVRAPFAGMVADKLVDPGDLATPGRVLFSLFNPDHMRLEAQVAEQFGPDLKSGAAVRVQVPSLRIDEPAVIDELVAQAANQSRTFLVKARLPAHPELRPGMFGRLSFDGRWRQALLVPENAVKNIGQLETVQALEGEVAVLRQVKTGKRYGPDIEILSGLQPGDRMLINN